MSCNYTCLSNRKKDIFLALTELIGAGYPCKWIEESSFVCGLSAKTHEYGKKIRLKALKLDLTHLFTNANKMQEISNCVPGSVNVPRFWGLKWGEWVDCAVCLLSRGLDFGSRLPACSAAVCRCKDSNLCSLCSQKSDIIGAFKRALRNSRNFCFLRGFWNKLTLWSSEGWTS